jgi:HEAT repeat protein
LLNRIEVLTEGANEMKRLIRLFAPAMMAALLVCAAYAASVDELLAKFPGQSVAETNAACAAIVDAGAPALAEICAKILPEASGNADLAARYAVSGLAKYCGAPGNAAARTLFAQALIDALGRATDPTIKQFFAFHLEWTGNDAAISALAALLVDPATVQSGAAALEAIATPAAVEALKERLAVAPDPCKARISKAIAVIGGAPAAPVAPNAVKTEGPSARAIALEALVREKGEKAAQELAAAASDPDPQYRGTALLLTKRIPGKVGSAPWARAMRGADDPAVRAQIAAMLATRDDEAAQKAVLSALHDDDMAVRSAVLETISGAVAERGKKVLFRMVAEPASNNEMVLAKQALKRAAGTAVADEAAKRYAKQCPCAAKDIPGWLPPKQDPPEIRRTWLEILTARGTEAHAHVPAGALQDGDASVRLEAYAALRAIGGAGQVEPVYSAFLAAKADNEETAERETLAAITKTDAAARESLTSRAIGKLAAASDADAPRLMRLLNTLGGAAGAKAVADAALSAALAEATRAEALHQLAVWPDTAGLSQIAALLESVESAPIRIAVIEAVCDAAKRASDRTDFSAAVMPVSAKLRNADEKRAYLKGLGSIRVVGAARAIAPFLDDPEVAADAGIALADSACMKNEKDKGLADLDILLLLEKVKTATKDEALIKRIQAHLDAIKK